MKITVHCRRHCYVIAPENDKTIKAQNYGNSGDVFGLEWEGHDKRHVPGINKFSLSTKFYENVLRVAVIKI